MPVKHGICKADISVWLINWEDAAGIARATKNWRASEGAKTAVNIQAGQNMEKQESNFLTESSVEYGAQEAKDKQVEKWLNMRQMS